LITGNQLHVRYAASHPCVMKCKETNTANQPHSHINPYNSTVAVHADCPYSNERAFYYISVLQHYRLVAHTRNKNSSRRGIPQRRTLVPLPM
jgi:hypothetical protein